MPTGSKTTKPSKRPTQPKPEAVKAELAPVALTVATQEDAKAPARKARSQTPAEDKAAVLKLKDLIDQVTDVSGAKKKDVKTIVEVTLARLRATLGRGESLNLQGFGHLRVARKATPESPVMTLKLRQSELGKPKAEAADED
jgi:DNA-binding protein HU-alpha